MSHLLERSPNFFVPLLHKHTLVNFDFDLSAGEKFMLQQNLQGRSRLRVLRFKNQFQKCVELRRDPVLERGDFLLSGAIDSSRHLEK
jgi:hypothetical protein